MRHFVLFNLVAICSAFNQFSHDVKSEIRSSVEENLQFNAAQLNPSKNPYVHPSKVPVKTRCPIVKPTAIPSLWRSPTLHPTSQPSSEPFSFPSSPPTESPSSQPSGEPSSTPSTQPSIEPSGIPSCEPSTEPASSPSSKPTMEPTHKPTVISTYQPSFSRPSAAPSNVLSSLVPTTSSSICPSVAVECLPTTEPSNIHVQYTKSPKSRPSKKPSNLPKSNPSRIPSILPIEAPSTIPSVVPSTPPSFAPSVSPSSEPSFNPSKKPSLKPSQRPSTKPSKRPTLKPSFDPRMIPSDTPSMSPTMVPSGAPSGISSTAPSPEPISLSSSVPSWNPSVLSSRIPSLLPSVEPFTVLTDIPSIGPSFRGSTKPINFPCKAPSVSPFNVPNSSLSTSPTCKPTNHHLTSIPSISLSVMPSIVPTSTPSSSAPSTVPHAVSSIYPSNTPSSSPSYKPIAKPSVAPSQGPFLISRRPTSTPTTPSVAPSSGPSMPPTVLPSIAHTTVPSSKPTKLPTIKPSKRPSVSPSLRPTAPPTTTPSYEPFTLSRVPTVVSSIIPTMPTVFPTIPTTSPTDGGIYFIAANITSILITSVTVQVVLSTQATNFGSLYCLAFLHGSSPPTSSKVQSYGTATNFVSLTSDGISVTLDNLSPLTKYSISCLATLYTGASRLYQLNLVAETACCKLVAFGNSPSFVYGDPSRYIINGMSSFSYVFSIFLSSAPGESVTITPTFSLNGQPSTAITAVPAFFVATNQTYTDSQLFSFYVRASDRTAGRFKLGLQVSGLSAAEYVNTTTTMVTIIPTGGAVLPAPRMTSAKFSDSGISFSILFDVPTDFANIFITTWACNRLFSFTNAGTSICTWVNASAVKSTIDPTSTLVPGQAISLNPNLLRSQCQSKSDCSLNLAAEGSTVNLLNPDNPIYPQVLLSTQSAAACQDLSIDASASSGSGGRPFTSLSWYVTNDGTPNDAVIEFLSNVVDISVPIKIPSSLIDPGNYQISLTLMNIFGNAGTAAISTYASANVYAPSVSIIGSTNVKIFPSDSLSITAVATISSCADATTSVTYRWTLLNSDGSAVPKIASLSRDPTQYVLAPYSLSVGSSFILSLTVTSTLRGKVEGQTTVLVNVFVTGTVIAASIVGGYTRKVPIDSKFVLNATSSQDLNYPQGKNPTSLLFAWTCAIVSFENFGGSCSLANVFDTTANVKAVASAKYGVVILPPYSLTANISYSFNVHAFSVDGRSDSKVLSVSTSLPGSLTVVPSFTFSAVNYGAQFTLNGFVRSNTSISVTMSWSLFSNSLPVPLSALTVLRRTFSSIHAMDGISFPLVVDPSCLQAARNYIFRLTAWPTALPRLTSYGDLQIRVRSPPQLGTVVSSPTYGYSLQTLFTLSAPGWVDDEAGAIPLSYIFSYQLSSSAHENIIGPISNLAYISTTLPEGLDVYGNNITIRVSVYDSFGGSNSATSTVTVSKNYTLSLSSFVAQNLAEAAKTGNNNLVYQAIAGATSSFKFDSCTSAPDCTKLYREACSTVPNTCGSCLSGYIGIAGAANYPCSNSSTTSGYLSKILALERTCPTNSTSLVCSGTGKCFKYDSIGAIIGSCTFGDTTCTVGCVCADGYGGSDCSITPQDLALRNTVRQVMCSALGSSVATTNPSASITAIHVSSMLQIYTPSEVHSTAMLQECANTFLAVSNHVYYGTITDEHTASKYINVLSNFVSKPLIASTDPNAAIDPTLIESYVSNFNAGYTRNLAAGQYPVNFTSSQVSITLRYDFASSLENLTLVPPSSSSTSSTDSRKGSNNSLSIQPSIKLPPSGLSACGLHKNKAQLSITAWNSNPYQSMNSSVAPLLRFGILRLPSELDNIIPSWAFNETYFITLPFATSQREHKRHVPECIIYDTKTDNPKKCPGCKVSSVSSASVTYVCNDISTLCTLFAIVETNQSTSRNLAKDDDISPVNQNSNPSSSNQPIDASKTFGTTFNALGSEIITVSSLQGFNPNTPAAKATIATFSFLIFLIVSGYFYFRHWDNVDCRDNDTRNKRIKDQLLKQQADAASMLNGDDSDGAYTLVTTKVNAEEVIEHFLSNILPAWVSDDVPIFWVFISALQKHHLYVSCFLKFSVVESRTLRFLKLMQYFLIVLFVNTLFFDIAYPYKFSCTGITDEHTCLSTVSSITGAPLCAWEPPSDDSVLGTAPFFNSTWPNSTSHMDDGTANAIIQSSYVCTFIPSGSGATYTLMVALMCLLISQPIQLLLVQVTYNYCIKTPDFRGLLSWLNRVPNADKITGHTPDPIYNLDHFDDTDPTIDSSDFDVAVKPSVEADSLIAEALYHKSELLTSNPAYTRKHDQSGAQNTKRSSRMIVEHFEKLAGVTVNEQTSNGASASLTPKEYGALCNKLTVARNKGEKIKKIILEMDGFHSHFRDNVLINRFIAEQLNRVQSYRFKMFVLSLDHIRAEKVAGWKWILGWVFYCGIIGYFMYFIFAWIAINATVTLQLWGLNMLVAFCQDFFGVQVVNVFIMYVMGIESIRPHLMHILILLKETAMMLTKHGPSKPGSTKHILQHFSGSCRAAYSEELKHLAAARILRELSDDDIAECHIFDRIGHIPFLVGIIFAALSFLALMSSSFGNLFIYDAIVPSAITAFFLFNSVLFSTNTGAMIAFYILLVALFLYVIFIFRPSKRRVIHAQDVMELRYMDTKINSKTLVDVTNYQSEEIPPPSTADKLIYALSWDGLYAAFRHVVVEAFARAETKLVLRHKRQNAAVERRLRETQKQQLKQLLKSRRNKGSDGHPSLHNTPKQQSQAVSSPTSLPLELFRPSNSIVR